MTHLLDRNLPSWKVQDATKLTAFCACPRKYFWEYVLGWRPEAPSNHLVFGQAWHAAQEHLLTTNYSIEEVQRAHEVFLATYRKVLPPETDEIFFPKTPDNALITLARYAGKFKDDHSKFNVKYTEISGKVTISEGRYLNFRMDSVLENKSNGQITSLDHKTGSRTWGWEIQFPLSHQTGTYTHVLYCIPRKLGIRLLRGATSRTRIPLSLLSTLHSDRLNRCSPGCGTRTFGMIRLSSSSSC
jgi:RecB family exonuclease